MKEVGGDPIVLRTTKDDAPDGTKCKNRTKYKAGDTKDRLGEESDNVTTRQCERYGAEDSWCHGVGRTTTVGCHLFPFALTLPNGTQTIIRSPDHDPDRHARPSDRHSPTEPKTINRSPNHDPDRHARTYLYTQCAVAGAEVYRNIIYNT